MEHAVSEDGTRVAYELVGEGRPLVVVHGTAADRDSWRGVAERLEGFEVALLERRGRGASTDGDDYSIGREVEDVLAVLDEYPEPALLGHSFGAVVALEAARRTDRISDLVLYEPPVLAGREGDAMAEDLRRIRDEEGEDAAVKAFLEAGVADDVDEWWPEWREEAPPGRTVLREVETVERYELADSVDARTSALLLHGTESPAHLQESTRAVADVLPNSRVVELEGLGHAGNAEAPDAVADVIESFLRE